MSHNPALTADPSAPPLTAELLRVNEEALAPGLSRWRSLAHQLLRDPLSVLGLLLVLGAVAMALVGPLLAPYQPSLPDYTAMNAGPSAAHPFGTDIIGFDVLSRVLHGARLSVGVAAAVLAIAVPIGLLLGAVAGYMGGLVDEVIMRVTDAFLAFPVLILAMAVAATLGAGLGSCVVALSVSFWPWYARLLRGQILSVKGREYVEAARAMGVSHLGILWRHILPNCLTPIVVELSMDMGYAMLSISSLSFIGLGAQPPSPEWGAMIVAGRDYFRSSWWITAFPGMALTLTVMGFNLLGDALPEALDPRRHGS